MTKPSKSGKYLTTEDWDAFKAAGVSEEELQADQPCGPLIFSYTRAQAIKDGVLVDITDIAKRVGFTIHTVMTVGVQNEMMEMLRRRKPEDFKKYSQEHIRMAGTAALLMGLVDKIRETKGQTDCLHFTAGDMKLWSLIGPGDDGEAVLTIMLEGED